MASWFHSSRNSLKKSQYYLWFLGSKESDGLRGRDYVLPIMRELMNDSVRRLPNKITVQVSEKGLKLIQSVPTVNKYGKVKTEVMKFYIPAHSITYSMIGPPPYSDVVATVLLVFNPETKCPIHVHCYRCDSPETAAIMNSNLQILINRPESQRRIAHLEHRLIESGLLLPPRTRNKFPGLSSRNGFDPTIQSVHSPPPPIRNDFENPYSAEDFGTRNHLGSDNYAGDSDETDYVGMSSEESDREDENSDSYRLAKLHQAVFRELKEKLRSEPPILLPPRDYCNTFRKSSDSKAKYDQRKQPSRKKLMNTPRHSPAERETTNFFWKRRERPREASREGSFRNTRLLSNSVTALDEGALTSSTSGLGSDLSSSGGRFRYSIADIATPTAYYGPEFSNDRELPEAGLSIRPRNLYRSESRSRDPRHDAFQRSPLDRDRRFNQFFSSENLYDPRRYPGPQSPPQNLRMFGDTFKPKKETLFQSKQSDPNSRYFQPNKHLDNGRKFGAKRALHRSMDNLHFVAQGSSGAPDKGTKWRSMVDPFGRRYEQSMKVDGFWKERAKQSSCYIQPQRNKF